MRRTARVRLWRLWPPGCRTVVVGSLAVRDLGTALTIVGLVVERYIRAVGRAPARNVELLAYVSDHEVAGIAALLCQGERRGFYLRWIRRRRGKLTRLSRLNNGRMLEALGEVVDADKVMTLINTNPGPDQRGSMDADIEALCRHYPGITPAQVWDWPCEDLVDAIRGVDAGARARDPTLDPEAIPTIRSADQIH